jgi:hypothetical protein
LFRTPHDRIHLDTLSLRFEPPLGLVILWSGVVNSDRVHAFTITNGG